MKMQCQPTWSADLLYRMGMEMTWRQQIPTVPLQLCRANGQQPAIPIRHAKDAKEPTFQLIPTEW